MIIDRESALYFIEKQMKIEKWAKTPEEKKYLRDKIEKTIELFIELDRKQFIKKLSRKELVGLFEKINNYKRNLGYLSRFFYEFLKMVVKRDKKEGDKFKITYKGEKYTVYFNEIIMINGITYASYCEFVKLMLSEIIDFKKICGREPSGIRDLIKILEEKVIQNNLFIDIDTDVRNAFFHLDIKFNKHKIYCKNRSGKNHITITELLSLLIKTSDFADIIEHMFVYTICEGIVNI